jgi:hypothetical protein
MEIYKPHIYLITDLKNNKPYYIGKHNGLNKHYITGSKILNRFISLYGLNAFYLRFKKNILKETTLETLDSLEEYYIKKFKTKTQGGNLTWGGRWDVCFRKAKTKPVLQYDLEGNFIQEWESVKQPIIEGVGTDYNGISACCLGKQNTANGFIWRFKEGIIDLKIIPSKRKKYKKGVKREKNQSIKINNITYKSITEAAKSLGYTFGKLNYKIKNNLIEYSWVK